MNFFIKLIGKKESSNCCQIQIQEIEENAACCNSNEEPANSCCETNSACC